MVGAGLVGTVGGVWLTLFLLAKSLMDAAQSDWGGEKDTGRRGHNWLKVVNWKKYYFYGSGALVGVGPKALRK